MLSFWRPCVSYWTLTLTSVSAFTQTSLFPTTIHQGAAHPLSYNVHFTSQNFLLIYSVRPCNPFFISLIPFNISILHFMWSILQLLQPIFFVSQSHMHLYRGRFQQKGLCPLLQALNQAHSAQIFHDSSLTVTAHKEAPE